MRTHSERAAKDRCWSEWKAWDGDLWRANFTNTDEREWSVLALNEDDEALRGHILAGPSM